MHHRMFDAELHRAAVHESGHATAALSFSLPLRTVFIRSDGSGGCGYARRLGVAEAIAWTVSALSGPLAEHMIYGGDAEEDGDLRVVAAMLRRLHLNWSDSLLTEYRCKARSLVERERHSIEVLADELLCRRSLTADEIGAVLSISAGAAPSFGAPEWVS
jgi:hypothetical protein